MDLDELGEVDEHSVPVLQRSRVPVAMDGDKVVGRQTTVRVPPRRYVRPRTAENCESLVPIAEMPGEWVVARDMRDEGPVRAFRPV